ILGPHTRDPLRYLRTEYLATPCISPLRSKYYTGIVVCVGLSSPNPLRPSSLPAMDFLKSAVASAISKAPPFPYTFGDRVDVGDSIWTLFNGTKRVSVAGPPD